MTIGVDTPSSLCRHTTSAHDCFPSVCFPVCEILLVVKGHHVKFIITLTLVPRPLHQHQLLPLSKHIGPLDSGVDISFGANTGTMAGFYIMCDARERKVEDVIYSWCPRRWSQFICSCFNRLSLLEQWVTGVQTSYSTSLRV